MTGPLVLLFGSGREMPELRAVLHSAGVELQQVHAVHEVVQAIIFSAPQCVLVSWRPDDPEITGLLYSLRHDALHAHLPVLLIVSHSHFHQVPWEEIEADDFWISSASPQELLTRVLMNVNRSVRHMDANPLTRFPGNTTIMREIQRRLDDPEPWGIAYLDLDFFKPFNDKYGFSRGDEVLRMTGRVLANAVLRKTQSFVGHVGGDDFTFIVRSGVLDETCREVTQSFDEIIPSFYDDDDRRRGYILSQDRMGNPAQFPLMTCSVAAVDTGHSKLEHVGELSKRIAEMKKATKSRPGSVHLIDRRK